MEGNQPSWTSQGKIDYIFDRDEGNTYAYIHSRKESYHGLYQEIELNESHNGGTLSASFMMKIDNSNVEIEFWDPYLFKNFRAQASFQFQPFQKASGESSRLETIRWSKTTCCNTLKAILRLKLSMKIYRLNTWDAFRHAQVSNLLQVLSAFF